MVINTNYMNELTTDLKLLHEATLNNLKSSKSKNTLRAYKSDFKDFGAFCSKHGLNSLPSEPKIVSLYLTHLSKNSKISTLRRRLVSISMVHKLKGHYLDTKHPIIVENLMGIKRVKGSIQKGKKPILINHLKSIINVINEQNIGDIKTPSTEQIGDVKEIKEQVKSVNYSILHIKAIKALQEAMTKIETLETKVKALEEA